MTTLTRERQTIDDVPLRVCCKQRPEDQGKAPPYTLYQYRHADMQFLQRASEMSATIQVVSERHGMHRPACVTYPSELQQLQCHANLLHCSVTTAGGMRHQR
jgi:predicted RNA methylase